MSEIYVNSLKSMFANKARAILTLFSIAVGVCAVLITVNISAVGTSAVQDEINGLGITGLALSANDAPLGTRELEEVRGCSYVRSAMPLVMETTNVYLKNDKKQICLWGIDQYADRTVSLKLTEGRFLNAADIASDAKVCMVDETFAKANYAVTGKSLTIKSGETTDKYRIIGILKTGSGLIQNMMGSYIPDFVYIPYSTMQKNTANQNFSQIVVRIDDQEDSDLYGKKLVSYLERLTDSRHAYTINDLSRQKENLDHILAIFTLVLSSVGAISLFVAGINTMNIMLVAVRERTKEIGIKKALGASRGAIVAEFLIMSFALSLIGAVLGVVMGSLISLAGAAYLGLTVNWNIGIIALTIGFTVLIGTVFGIYPAVKAARLDPVEAFRYF